MERKSEWRVRPSPRRVQGHHWGIRCWLRWRHRCRGWGPLLKDISNKWFPLHHAELMLCLRSPKTICERWCCKHWWGCTSWVPLTREMVFSAEKSGDPTQLSERLSQPAPLSWGAGLTPFLRLTHWHPHLSAGGRSGEGEMTANPVLSREGALWWQSLTSHWTCLAYTVFLAGLHCGHLSSWL